MIKILLTNGAYKQTLAIARSLGAAGYDVGIVSHHWLSVSFFSKYCRFRHIIKTKEPKEYTNQLISLLKKYKYDIVLPIGYPVTGWLAERSEAIKVVAKLPLADFKSFEIFESKQLTHDLARQLDIPTPLTFAPKNRAESENCLAKLSFPIVFKKTKEGENRVEYAENERDFFIFFDEFSKSNEGFIVQEFLTGQGAGYFAMFQNGILIQDFMHLRLREYPVAGGAACYAESIDNEQIRVLGSRILTAQKWHGVAMVEFKFDSQGVPKLLEVNPKFWGSYDLCVAAGADFAVPLVKMTMGENQARPPQYKTSVRFSWLMNGDLLHGFETHQVRLVFKDFFSKNTYSNLTWRDPMASLFLILTGCLSIIKTLLKR